MCQGRLIAVFTFVMFASEATATNLMSSPRAIERFDFEVVSLERVVDDDQVVKKVYSVGLKTLIRRIAADDELYSLLGPQGLQSLRLARGDAELIEQLGNELPEEVIGAWIDDLGAAGFDPDRLLLVDEIESLDTTEPIVEDNEITFAGIDARTLFGGLSVGGGDEQRTIKLTALQYDVILGTRKDGRSIKLPFAVLSADVSSVGDSSMANAQKLLDPSQGVLNLQFTKAYKFNVGSFCRLEGDTGCSYGIQGGFRYTELEETKMTPAMGMTPATMETDKQNVWGAYARLGVNSVFDVVERVIGVSDPEYGKLSLGVNYNWYRQNLSDSTILFPNATDALGNPITFDKSYESLGAHLELALPGQFSLKAQYFDPSGEEMENTFTIELTYSPKKEES